MFSNLTSKIYNTIKYTVSALAIISFFTMVLYSVFVINKDFNTKYSQLATQYSKCIESQITSTAKPTILIKNSVINAVKENDISQFDTLIRIVRMSHPFTKSFELHTSDDSLPESPGYTLKDNKTLTYVMEYFIPGSPSAYGVLSIDLSALINSLELDSNIFMKNTDIYISQDHINYYNLTEPKILTVPISKDKLHALSDSEISTSEIFDGKFIICIVPNKVLVSKAWIFIILTFVLLLLLLIFAFKIIKKYTTYTEKQLNSLVNDMDEYIQKRKDDKDA